MTKLNAVASLSQVSLRYKKNLALDKITLEIPAQQIVGLIGPDGVGKSSLMALISGARAIQTGSIIVLGSDMANFKQRTHICPNIAYMPQGLGKNLYPTLTIEENLQFFARLFGHNAKERRQRIDELTQATELYPFLERPVANLSGGMKQKLGLCCALIHDPDLLILDEPTTGVDPLARIQFWELINQIRYKHPSMSVIIATAYMEEAARFDWLVALDAGKVLAVGKPQALLQQTKTASLEQAFIALLPQERKQNHHPVVVPPLSDGVTTPIAIEAHNLTKRFGNFTAVNHVSFRIRRGEIFGFLGSNGCGKSTTMKMLTGLLPASEGQAWLFGKEVNPHDIATRKRVGYMSQGFSLYSELTVRQNLILHARLFKLPEATIAPRIQEMAQRFGLNEVLEALPDNLPLGIRQRLSLAVAMVHNPEMLILDEPTSGVDPIARDIFWHFMIELARKDKITIFISTHFMNEAERCDRISLMHAGQVLVSDAPAKLIQNRHTATLEEAFISYLIEANAHTPSQHHPPTKKIPHTNKPFSIGRILSYTIRESLELYRDPVRGIMALLGSLILMLIMGYGISMDVENLSFAVLDRDQTILSHNYTLNLAGSHYFKEHAPLVDYADLNWRMVTGELSLALEIPSGFARDLQHGKPVQIAAWIDGAMPQRAETVQGYVTGMHQTWLNTLAPQTNFGARIETRFRYNPDVKSLPAIVPAVIPILLLMIPAILTALSVVREKELGSIINLYVTPITRAEFFISKQIPYILLGMVNFFLMTLLATTFFSVPLKGSFITLTLAAFCYLGFATGFGLFASIFTHSQIAAIFMTMIGTILPAIQFAGLLNPVSTLVGLGRLIGHLYPATYFLIICRGVFTKALSLLDLNLYFIPLILAAIIILLLSIVLLKKQET